jgi:hypothetical protein
MGTPADAAGGLVVDPGAFRYRSGRGLATKWIVIILVVVLVAIYLAVVLLNEDLRRDYFVQRLTGPIIALAFTVILFSAFKSVAVLQMPVQVGGLSLPAGTGNWVLTIAGAAAFFYLLLGPISKILFPPDQNVAGYIFYKRANPDEGFVAVPNVQVRVPETYQMSAPTSNDGRFVITNLTFHPKSLDALYFNTVYVFEARDPAGRYPIIPHPSQNVPTATTSIAGTEWVDLGNKCVDSNTKGYRSVKLLMLRKTIAAVAGYSTLVIKMNSQQPVYLVDLQKELPDNAGAEDKISEDQTMARQWLIPVVGDKTEVKFTVCLGTRVPGPPPPRNGLSTAYWFK